MYLRVRLRIVAFPLHHPDRSVTFLFQTKDIKLALLR